MKAPALVAVLLAALTVGSIQALGGSAASTTPAALVPNWIGFWDKEHGLMGTGNEGELGTPDQECRHGKCHPGTISVSTDGGRTSHVLVRTHGPVTWVCCTEAAGVGRRP